MVGCKESTFSKCLGSGTALSLYFWRIAANVTEFTRPFDEAALPPRTLLAGCSVVAEPVNFAGRQLRGLAPTSRTALPRSGSASASKSLLDEPANRLRKRRPVILMLRPGADLGLKGRGKAHGGDGISACGRTPSLFWYYRY
jgi:hypothetical protein